MEAEIPILSQWCRLTKNCEKSYHKEREENGMQASEKSGRDSIWKLIAELLQSRDKPSASTTQVSLSHAIMQ